MWLGGEAGVCEFCECSLGWVGGQEALEVLGEKGELIAWKRPIDDVSSCGA